MKSCEGSGSNSVARRSGASGATTRIKEANKAREVHANLKRPTTTCVVIVAKKATRPENGVRKNTTRRPKPTWSRGRKKTRAYSWPTGDDGIALHQSVYVSKLLDHYGMGSCNSTVSPMESIIGVHHWLQEHHWCTPIPAAQPAISCIRGWVS
jgi:hypothetical protein